MYLNKVIISGRITDKPELRATKDGNQVTNFSVAVNESYKTSAGEKKEVVDFIDVTVFGKLAPICAEYLIKGQSVLVEGKMKTRRYEVNNEPRYRTFIQAMNVQFGAKPNGERQESTKTETTKAKVAQQDNDKGYEYPTENINPDDIPF